MESILANTTPNELAPPSTSNSISGGVPGKKKTAASRVNPNLFRSHSPAMDFSLEAEEENLSKTKDKILGDQDLIDLAAARENPKLAPMVKNINVLVEKTQKARKDLELMMQTSVDLKNQCKLQEEECLVLDQEQKKVNLEMIDMRNKVDTLGNEKALLEAKLAHLRRENDDLEAFLSQVDPLNPNPTSTSMAASSNN